MSNYLNQLVAKNLNLIDTVQPFHLSVFGFLPESPAEMGSEESWGINPEIVMGGDGDSEQTSTAASFLADKSDSKLSSTQPFPQPVEILPTTDKIPPTPNIQLFSSDSASGRVTQKELEAISSHRIPQKQPVTESSRQQPVEINQVFPSPAEPKVIREQLSSQQSPPQSEAIAPARSFVLGAIDTQVLTPALSVSAITPLSEPAVKLQKQSVPFLSGQPAIESNRFVPSAPSSKVIREELSFHQLQSESEAIAQAKSEVLGAIDTQPLTPALTVETNTRFLHPAVEQLTQPATESKEPQSVKIPPAVSLTQSPKVVSSLRSLTQPQSEPVVIEPTPDQVPTQGIVPVGAQGIVPVGAQGLAPLPSHFPDNPPNPTPNIVQPINDDSRRSSVFVSASRQEQRQRESFGNSTAPPTIKVSIGSMEIRTPSPPPPPPRPKPRPKPPVMSLDEYLRQRSRGR
ncbi:MAG: hypothetical protein DSM106950_37580 [Stigonema ocellatum SAG 48.90 = DSM 106950]|nr:hypothetical protein [Stigonema ocellatum SAG 48.90 = DSM 106950]